MAESILDKCVSDKSILDKSNVVYLMTNKLNLMRYVGKTTKKLRRRLYEHKCIKGNQNTYIGRAIAFYGWENFSVEILEECADAKQLNEREIYWIAKLNTKAPNGYNLTEGGAGCTGYEVNYKTRYTRSLSNPRKRPVRCLENGVIYESLAAAARATEIGIKYISRNCTGSRTHALKLHFEFVNKELREKAELRKKQKKNLSKRPIICLDTGEIFESAAEAARHFNILASTICSVCRGKLIRSGGMKFEYLDQPLSEENRLRERKRPAAVKIFCVTTGEIFNTIAAAAKHFGLSTMSINQVCCGKCRHAKGYVFEFVDEKLKAEAEIKRQKLCIMKKAVLCEETGIVYESISKAAKAFNVSVTSIKNACNSEKTVGGYHFEFVK